MIKTAVMGYGTIGSGVVEVLDINGSSIAKRVGEPVEIKYVLDLRDFPGGRAGDRAEVCAGSAGVSRQPHRR